MVGAEFTLVGTGVEVGVAVILQVDFAGKVAATDLTDEGAAMHVDPVATQFHLVIKLFACTSKRKFSHTHTKNAFNYPNKSKFKLQSFSEINVKPC